MRLVKFLFLFYLIFAHVVALGLLQYQWLLGWNIDIPARFLG